MVRGDPQPCTWPLTWRGPMQVKMERRGSAEKEEEEGVRAPTGVLTVGGASRTPGVTGKDKQSHLNSACLSWGHTRSQGDWGLGLSLVTIPATHGAQAHPLHGHSRWGWKKSLVPGHHVALSPIYPPVLLPDQHMPLAHPGPLPSLVLARSPCPHLRFSY